MSKSKKLNEPVAWSESRASLFRRLAGPLAVLAMGAVLYLSIDRLGRVSGVVTLDDQPLTSGLIRFHPVTKGPVGSASIDEQGRYEILTNGEPGVTSGEYLVTVTDEPPSAESNNPPARYAETATSGLRVNVRWGSNQINFNLHSAN